MYDERFITPMRQELTRLGVEEMRTPDEVDARLKDAKGTTLVVVNSMCGCAARNGAPRRRDGAPAHRQARCTSRRCSPARMRDATERARGYFTGYAPSSPQIALMKDGKIVFMLERWQIEGRSAGRDRRRPRARRSTSTGDGTGERPWAAEPDVRYALGTSSAFLRLPSEGGSHGA